MQESWDLQLHGGTQLPPSLWFSLQRRTDLLAGFTQCLCSLLILSFPPYSFRDTAARQTASGTEVCVTALLPSQLLCPEPAEPITASQESFPCLAFKVFRYLRTQRNKRNFNDTLSLVFPVTWKVLSTSENLTQH